jgi:hypothetical protein
VQHDLGGPPRCELAETRGQAAHLHVGDEVEDDGQLGRPQQAVDRAH